MTFFLVNLLACLPHSTDSTEVGVRTVRIAAIGDPGVVTEIYSPGGTYFFPPILNDWYVFDVAVQNMAMVRDPAISGRGDDSLQFKTHDGNDISVDVTVTWRIIGEKAPYLLQFVGDDTRIVEERLLRPVARSVVRDLLNEMRSEQFYDASLRYAQAEAARDACNHYLQPEGIMVEQILLGEHHFNPAYEEVIKDKTLADQQASKLRSESEAAREQRKSELEVAKGGASQAIETAKGEAQKTQLEADGAYFEKQRKAEALLVEAKSKAEGLRARARAMSGSGGKAMVKLKVAEALKDKPILFIPATGGDLRTTDMNALLQQYAVTKK